MKRIYYLAALFLTAYQINAQTYCTPAFSSGCSDGDMIDSFTIPSASFADMSTGCSTGAYGNYYDTQTINLQAGVPYSYQVTHGFSSQKVKIWIDFNNDGVFANDATETVSSASAGSNQYTDGTILIPGSVTPGTYRMRVGDKYSSDPIPCNIDGYGEAHDYKVVVSAAPACVSPSSVTNTAVTATSVNMAWTASTSNPSNGYDVYYSNSNAPADASTTPSFTGITGLSKAITGLQPSTDYYLWVRSNCGSGQSLWYYGGKITTLTFCPTVTAPANGANGISLTPTITWTAVAGATSYTLTVGSMPGGSDIMGGVDVGNVTTYTFATPLVNSTNYYYTVNAHNVTTDSNNCQERSFTTVCTPYSIPYFEGFETGYTHNTTVAGCLAQVGTTGSNTWNANNTFTDYNRTPRTGSWNAFLRYGNTRWLFIPIQLTGGVAYQVKAYARQDGATAANSNITIAYGTAATDAAMTNTIVPATGIVNGDYQKISGNFVPATTGTYFVGIKGYMNSSPWYISLDDISIDLAPACLEPTTLAASNIGSATATVSWTAPATAPAGGYDVYYSTVNTDPTATSTPNANVAAGTYTMSGLTPNTQYFVWVRSHCSSASQSLWVPLPSLTTGQIAATLPYTQNFSGANDFALNNGTQTNQWFVGNAEGNPAGSLYITNDGGVTNAYTNNALSVVQAYRDIAIPAGTTLATLSFDWKGFGEASTFYDYFRVWLVPTSFNPVVGTQISAGTGRIQIGDSFNQQNTWQNYLNTNVNLSSFAGQTMRLVFEWYNDGSIGTNPPAAIDNINLFIPSCVSPTGVATPTIATTTATVSWTAPSPVPAGGYDVYYSTTNTAPTAATTPTATVATTSYNIVGLNSSTTYYVWVRSHCSSSSMSTWTPVVSFTTLCNTFATPFTETFSTGVIPNCWKNFSTDNTGYALWRFSGVPDYGTTNNGATPGQFAWLDASSPYTGVHDVTLESPAIDLTGLTTPMLEFKWFKNHLSTATGTVQPAYDNNKLTVMVKKIGGSTWETIFANTSNDATWRTVKINLPASYAASVVQFRFVADKDVAGNGYFYDNILLDDISVIQSTLATSEIASTKDAIIIYPNPFADVLHISDVRNVKAIAITDASGRLVKTIDRPTSELQLGDLKTGMYLVTLQYKDGSAKTMKAMKK